MDNHLPYKYFRLLSNLYFLRLEFHVADPIAESNGCLIKMEKKADPGAAQDQKEQPLARRIGAAAPRSIAFDLLESVQKSPSFFFFLLVDRGKQMRLVASLKLTKLNCSFRGTKHAANACSNLFDGLLLLASRKGSPAPAGDDRRGWLPNSLIYCPWGWSWSPDPGQIAAAIGQMHIKRSIYLFQQLLQS